MKTMSPAKLEANRRNAKRSTGPKTPQGKATSARNAFRHGLSSGEITVLPTEKQEDLDRLIRELTEQNEPTTPAEQFLVDQMIHARWRLLRARRLEAEAFDQLLESDTAIDHRILNTIATPGNILDKLDRYAAAAGRAYSKAVRDLIQLRANTQKAKKQNKAKEAEKWLAEELAKVKKRPLPAYLFPQPMPPVQNEANFAPQTRAARL